MQYIYSLNICINNKYFTILQISGHIKYVNIKSSIIIILVINTDIWNHSGRGLGLYSVQQCSMHGTLKKKNMSPRIENIRMDHKKSSSFVNIKIN